MRAQRVLAQPGKPEGGSDGEALTADFRITPHVEKIESQAYTIGLTPQEFSHLTPKQWRAIIEGHEKQQERLDYRAALLCMVMANVHGANMRVSDFMPRKPQTVEQQFEMIKALNALFGGKDETSGVTPGAE